MCCSFRPYLTWLSHDTKWLALSADRFDIWYTCRQHEVLMKNTKYPKIDFPVRSGYHCTYLREVIKQTACTDWSSGHSQTLHNIAVLSSNPRARCTIVWHYLALPSRRLCTTFADPKRFSPLLVCHLIALDKSLGVRRIGLCETARRIIAKAVLSFIKGDLQIVASPRQLCAGQI